jgi:hypothetical protein
VAEGRIVDDAVCGAVDGVALWRMCEYARRSGGGGPDLRFRTSLWMVVFQVSAEMKFAEPMAPVMG